MTKYPDKNPLSHIYSELGPQSDFAEGSDVPVARGAVNNEVVALLRELIAGQDRQNELLEEMVIQSNRAQRQRNNELGQWQQANPRLAANCRAAAESLNQVQMRFIEDLTEEVNENAEALLDGEFVLNEFVDRFGPRLAHLNGVLHVLSQLSSTSHPTGP